MQPKKRLDYHSELFKLYTNEEITLEQLREKLNKHNEKLEKRRKYKQGDAITSIDELLQQEWVFVFGKPRHIEFVKSLQFRNILDLIERKNIWKAIKKQKNSWQIKNDSV